MQSTRRVAAWLLLLPICAVTLAMLLWVQPWSVLPGNPNIPAQTARTTWAASLPTQKMGLFDCSTAEYRNQWACWGKVSFRLADGTHFQGQVLLVDTTRKACANASATEQASAYPNGCGYLRVEYDAANPSQIALVTGNPTVAQRWFNFAALVVFPCVAVGVALGVLIAVVLSEVATRSGLVESRSTGDDSGLPART